MTEQVAIAYNQQMVAVLLLVLVLVLSPIIILLVRKIAVTMQVSRPDRHPLVKGAFGTKTIICSRIAHTKRCAQCSCLRTDSTRVS